MKTALVSLLVIGSLHLIGARAGGQQQDLSQELEEAKKLYATGNFPRAAATLGLVIRSLQLQPSSPNQISMLLDAHLHLGLTYVVLNDPDSARESFRAVLALDPEYQLNPDHHAPRFVSLFEEVRDEIETRKAPSAVFSPPSTEGKSGSKLPLILGIVGGGAATAVLVSGSASGSDAATMTPTSVTQQVAPTTVTQQFAATDVPISIGGREASSTLTFPNTGTIQDIAVNVSLVHRIVSELELFLTGPNGRRVLFRTTTCADAVLVSRCRDLDISYDPSNAPALNEFLATSSEGVWVFTVVDSHPNAFGILSNWSLRLTILQE